MLMSQLSAEAVAPTMRMKRGEWGIVESRNRVCFYNTYSAQVVGKYVMSLDIFGNSAKLMNSVPVGGGQAVCVTLYPRMAVRAGTPGVYPTHASTHAEMDGVSADNEGNGQLDVR